MEYSRKISFLIITLIYILASAVGIVSFIYLPYELWLNLLLADIIATIIIFIFSTIFKNSSVYDPYWSVQPIVIILGFAISTELTLIKIVLIVAILYWGIRLTSNWAYTFHGLNFEDWRYVQLREKTKRFYPIVDLMGIHLMPTLIVYLCVLPAVLMIVGNPNNSALGILFLIVSFGATTMQMIADMQMHRFRKNKTGVFIKNGFWKHSRHPNYLGEILMWWGIGLASVASLGEWYLIIGAIINTLLFIFISIPMAEKKLSKRDGFLEYKNCTRMLLPLPKFKK